MSNRVASASRVVSRPLEILVIIYNSYTLSDLQKHQTKRVNLPKFWFRHVVPSTDTFCSCEGQHRTCLTFGPAFDFVSAQGVFSQKRVTAGKHWQESWVIWGSGAKSFSDVRSIFKGRF